MNAVRNYRTGLGLSCMQSKPVDLCGGIEQNIHPHAYIVNCHCAICISFL